MGVGLGFYSFQDCYPCDGEEILLLQVDNYDKFYALDKAVISNPDSDNIMWIRRKDGSGFLLGGNRPILSRYFWMKLSEANKLIAESIAEALK